MSDLEKHLITGEDCQILAKEYERTNYAVINNSRKHDKPDSKYYTFDLEVLQDYINVIREGLEKKGIKNKGIRVNLGKYPEERFNEKLDPAYLGYQTVFFSATSIEPDSMISPQRTEDEKDLPGLNFGQLCPP
ncbi:hypothetical protein [Kaistella polysaccharea]|uniref:hypothetical protein n=1 Tax=Kaistella polysaccharea TaxID=2878534 RepID=UPI001CF43E83|nr:hypothetical protein [Kaistella polysaccharea]